MDEVENQWTLTINKNLLELIQCTRINYELVLNLFQNQLITTSEREKLEDPGILDSEKTNFLFTKVAFKWAQEEFDKFKKALKDSGYTRSLKLLSGKVETELTNESHGIDSRVPNETKHPNTTKTNGNATEYLPRKDGPNFYVPPLRTQQQRVPYTNGQRVFNTAECRRTSNGNPNQDQLNWRSDRPDVPRPSYEPANRTTQQDQLKCPERRHPETLQNDNELLKKELDRINLIFEGIPESPVENDQELRRSVTQLLSRMSCSEIIFDCATRLGDYTSSPYHTRPVRVRFFSEAQRDLVFAARKQVPKDYYVNEDLPKPIRVANGILRKKYKSAIQGGIPKNEIYTNWEEKTITVRGELFIISDGKLCSTGKVHMTR